MIYLDGTATTKPSKEAIRDFNFACERYWFNPSSTNYTDGMSTNIMLYNSRKIIADCIGCEPDNIIFTSGSTEGINWVMKCGGWDEIILSTIEHPAVDNTAKYLRSIGKMISYIPVNTHGIVDMDVLIDKLEAAQLNSRRALVCIMDSNNEIGTVQTTQDLITITHSYGAKYLCDMTQSFAHSDVVSVNMGYDYAVASAQKFHGIRGIGFVYAHNPTSLTPLLHGGHQEANLRAGTEPLPLIYSMANQFKRVCEDRKSVYECLSDMKYCFLENLEFEHIVNGYIVSIPSVISLQIPGIDANKLLTLLDMDGICVSAGSACSTGENKPSRILKAIGLSDEAARSTIRISLDESLTQDELYAAISSLNKNVKTLKRMGIYG